MHVASQTPAVLTRKRQPPPIYRHVSVRLAVYIVVYSSSRLTVYVQYTVVLLCGASLGCQSLNF